MKTLPVTLSLSFALLLAGCAHNPTRHVTLPPDVAQPRLRELLDYLADHQFQHARQATVFDFSAWPMYDAPEWDDYDRKPRFEAASFLHHDNRIDVSVSPAKPFAPDDDVFEKVVLTYPRQHNDPNGASVTLHGRKWSLAFKLHQPDAQLVTRLADLLRDFARQYARQLTTQPAH